jgi:predicted PurR-regulated permease PerM
MTHRHRLYILVPLLAICLYISYMIVSPFLSEMASAVILGVVLYPVYSWIHQRFRNPNLAAAFATLLAALIILAPAFVLGITLTAEVRDLAAQLRARAGADGLVPYLTTQIETTLQWVAERINVPVGQVEQEILSRLEALGTYILRKAGTVVNSLGAFLVGAVLTCFILFFVFRQGHLVMEFFFDLLAIRSERAAEISRRLRDTIMANVLGVIVVAAVQGFLVGLGFFIVGLPSAVLWGVIAGVCSVIPVVGTAIIWLPAVIFLFASGAYAKGAILTGWCAIIVGLSDNVVRPWIVGGRAGMNGLVVFFALLGGMQAFGFIGIFLGPLVFSVTREVFIMIEEERHRLPAVTLPEEA